MEIIKQRFAEHITYAQQVAESRILEPDGSDRTVSAA